MVGPAEEHLWLAEEMAAKVPHPGLRRDEALSAALLGLVMAEAKNPSGYTDYAAQAARHAIRQDVRREYRYRRAQRWHAARRHGGRTPDHTPSILDRDEFESLLAHIDNPRQVQAVRLWALGYTRNEIGDMIGVRPKGAAALVNRGIGRLRKQLIGKGIHAL